MQQDPYQQFASPYVALGGDPVNMIDPSGGWSSLATSFAKAVGMSTTKIGLAAVTTLVGALIGNAAYAAAGGKGAKGLIIGAFAGLASNFVGSGASAIGKPLLQAVVGGTKILVDNAAAMPTVTPRPVPITNTGTIAEGAKYASNNGGNGDDDWEPFYKENLKTYTQSKGIDPTENNLGDQLEKIFKEFMEKSFPAQTKLLKFRQPSKPWKEGTGRNTMPDFVSDDFYDENDGCWICKKKIKWVIEGSAYEVKQNSGKGIYLSSNDDQIRGHIDNLAAKHAIDIASRVYNPSLTLITTYDVKWSPSITKYASKREVQYTHRRAMYRIVNNVYQFKFVGFGTSSW